MRPPDSTRIPVLAAQAAALVAVLVLAVWMDSRSLERGNRLHRDTRHSEAAALYRARAERAAVPDGRTRYNLATTLLEEGAPDEARDLLEGTLDTRDSVVAYRAHYNLGRHLLIGAIGHPSPDSAEGLARAAIDHNQEALRLAPASEDARWNLALSQRALDSLLWLGSGVDEEEVRDSLEVQDPDAALPALLRELQEQSGSFGAQFFSSGEREALARDLARSPLTEEEAVRFLTGMDQSPGQVLRRVFRVQSPNRWGNLGGGRRRSW